MPTPFGIRADADDVVKTGRTRAWCAGGCTRAAGGRDGAGRTIRRITRVRLALYGRRILAWQGTGVRRIPLAAVADHPAGGSSTRMTACEQLADALDVGAVAVVGAEAPDSLWCIRPVHTCRLDRSARPFQLHTPSQSPPASLPWALSRSLWSWWTRPVRRSSSPPLRPRLVRRPPSVSLPAASECA